MEWQIFLDTGNEKNNKTLLQNKTLLWCTQWQSPSPCLLRVSPEEARVQSKRQDWLYKAVL